MYKGSKAQKGYINIWKKKHACIYNLHIFVDFNFLYIKRSGFDNDLKYAH